MHKRTVLLILVLFYTTLKASVPDKPTGGQGTALGQTWISLNSYWSSLQNQAGLAWQSNPWIGVHHENRFLINELSLSEIGAILPTSSGNFGFNISHFGYSQFNVTRGGFLYGMKLSENFSAGVGFNYHHLQIAGDYARKNAYTVEGGILYMPTEKLVLGAYLFNPTHASLDNQQSMPSLFGFGVSYLPTSKITMVLQVDDDTERKPVVRGGFEIEALKGFALRLGYSSGNPEGITGGFGWLVKNIQVDLAFGYHQVLGYTPQLSVSYRFGRRNDKLP
ncbi:MAG: hypothetical protein AB7S48_03705 [Bacteroidales bacterium]